VGGDEVHDCELIVETVEKAIRKRVLSSTVQLSLR
jgi:hypothetical protein